LEKKHQNAHGFPQEFLQSCKRYQPCQKLKRRGKSCSLHSKKLFGWGCGFFVSDVISGRLFGQLNLAMGSNH